MGWGVFAWIDSGWVQGIAIFFGAVWYVNFIDKQHRKTAEDAQAKIERIWEHMSKLEDKIYKQTEWAIAASEKMMHDADRRRLADRLYTEYKPEPNDGESGVELWFRKDQEIKEECYRRYPKKEIEDFMK